MFTCPRYGLLPVIVLMFLLTACSTPAPTSGDVPTALPTSTLLPSTATDVPPTATTMPTSTPTPKPSLSPLRFADNPDMTNALPDGAKFDFGVQAIYAGLDFVNLPAKSKIRWVLTRDDYEVLATNEYLTATTGSTTRVLIDQPRLLLPGAYKLTATGGYLGVSASFTIDVTGLKPGAAMLTERFDDNDLDWSVYSDDAGSALIERGHLQMSINEAESNAASFLPAVLKDFDVSIAVQRIEGARDGYYGVLFRYSDDEGYVFEVGDNGYFNVATWTDEAYTRLIEWTRSPAIKSGQINALRVVARGDKFAFYINEQQVATLSDAQYQSGNIGFFAGNFEQAGVKVTFDDVIVTLPEESALAAVPTKAATALPRATPGPAPTAKPQTPPLADVIARTRKAVESLGGAMDRLYGGGFEACAPFMADYNTVVGAPTYDVSAQSTKVQGAYAAYRQAVAIIQDKVDSIAGVCRKGGGMPGRLSFDIARTAVNDAGNLLISALAALGQ